MKFTIYRDEQREFRWTLWATNGRKLADSGEGYKSKAHCKRMVNKIMQTAHAAEIATDSTQKTEGISCPKS